MQFNQMKTFLFEDEKLLIVFYIHNVLSWYVLVGGHKLYGRQKIDFYVFKL